MTITGVPRLTRAHPDRRVTLSARFLEVSQDADYIGMVKGTTAAPAGNGQPLLPGPMDFADVLHTIDPPDHPLDVIRNGDDLEFGAMTVGF